MTEILVRSEEKAYLIDSITALPDNAQLLEFGSGGSTILFASLLKPGQHLTSVEHNEEWYNKVNVELATLDLWEKVTMFFVPVNTKAYATKDEEDIIPGSEPYRNPPIDWSAIRWVFCDGIMRGPILSEIRPKLLPGTDVFLHDFCGRESWYSEHLAGYERIETIRTLLHLRTGQWLL